MNLQFFSKHLCLLALCCSPFIPDSITAADPSAADATRGLKVTSADDCLTVSDGGQPVLKYQLQVQSQNGRWPRNNYVHPLHDLSGKVITEDFPADHKHHRGIFWAWHQVWVGDTRLGDAWVCKDFIWELQSSDAKVNSEGAAVLTAEFHWKSPALKDSDGALIPAVHERTQITVHPATTEFRFVDFHIQLRALQTNVRIGGSEDIKGYGGFSPRIALTPGQTFTAVTGALEPAITAIEAGPWMNLSGPESGVTIISHPANPGYPEPWILRRQRSMQNAAWPGATPVALPDKQPLSLKYRLVIHRGAASEIDMSALSDEFASHSDPR